MLSELSVQLRRLSVPRLSICGLRRLRVNPSPELRTTPYGVTISALHAPSFVDIEPNIFIGCFHGLVSFPGGFGCFQHDPFLSADRLRSDPEQPAFRGTSTLVYFNACVSHISIVSRQNMKKLTIVLLILLTGCATHQIAVSKAPVVPADRVSWISPNGDSQHAFILFVRDTGFAGAGGTIYLSIDGKDAARMRAGEKLVLAVPLGQHSFTVRNRESPDSWGSRPRTAETEILAGREYSFRIGFFDAQNLQIEPFRK